MALELVKNGIRRIKEFLTGNKDITKGTRIVINCERLENRVALLENGVLEEYTVERVGTTHIVGSIYKGRVKNIEQGLKAMFVDIGLEKNAFLHFWDAIPAALDVQSMEEIEPRRQKTEAARRTITAKDIPDIYPVGSEILVQVTKGPIGNKGPRVTTNISLAGRLLVLMPLQRAVRHLPQDRGSQGARPPAQDHRETQRARGHGHHHAHRGLRQARPPLRPRPRHAAGAVER